MKNILKMTMLLAVAALAFSSCNSVKKMAKSQHQFELSKDGQLAVAKGGIVFMTCNPEVLVLNNGKVAADINFNFPEKYFGKNVEMCVTPVLVFEGGEVAAPAKYFQGEKVKGNNVVVPVAGGKFAHHVEFVYDDRMEQSALHLRVAVKTGKGAYKEFVQLFDAVVAKGVNTLQKNFNYAAAMQSVANNYKNVTTVVTKADVAYRINSSKVCKKAVQTEALAALKAKVEENKANDRAKQSVYVNGYASPDGPEKFNDKLSSARSESGKKAVEKLLAEAGLQIDAASYGEDWEGFKEAVAASNIADKDLILQVLGMYDSSAQREKEIKNMSSVYKSLKTDVLPQLRRAQVVNSADITGKTDDEMEALVKAGNAAALDLEELLHVAEVRPEVAVAALDFAASKYNDARVYNNLGLAYAEAGENAKALAAFEKAVKAGGNSAELNNNLALANLANGNVEKAKEYAKAGNAKVQALVNAAEGNYAQASAKLEGYNAAVAQVMNGDLAAAKKSIANDNSAKADYLRAVIAAKEGNVNNAKAQLNSAISKDASLAAKAKKDVNLVSLF